MTELRWRWLAQARLMRDEFSKHRCLGQEWRRLLEAAKRTVSRSFLCLLFFVRELVSHASRIEWCNMRRYSAFAACVCDVYVCVCVCERCGLFREFCWTARIASFVLIIIIRTLWRYGEDGLPALRMAVVGPQRRSV